MEKIVLTREEYNKFLAILDRPPTRIPELQKLLKSPTKKESEDE